MKNILKVLAIIPLVLLAGCFQAYSDDPENIRTVPTTNNPNLVPNHSTFIPGAY